MEKTYYLPPHLKLHSRAMLFVDGENLAMGYGRLLKKENGIPKDHIVYEKDILVWMRFLPAHFDTRCELIRTYYYTCVSGDDPRIEGVEDQLKSLGIEAPRVFRKNKNGKSKRVDISLATEMLTHAHRKNYDIAILVAGDEDYVPLVEAVQNEGCRVVLWFFEMQGGGLSRQLRSAADHCFDISTFLFNDKTYLERRYFP